MEFRWFGDAETFAGSRRKGLCLSYLSILILLICSILCTANVGFYTTYTLFENIWMLLLICTTVYMHKAMRFYPCERLVANSFYHFEQNVNGIYFRQRMKGRYVAFVCLYIFSVIGNIFMLWGMGYFVIVLEIVGLIVSLYAFFVRAVRFFSEYSFVQITGLNDSMTQTIVLVYDPGIDMFFEQADFENKFPLAK